MWLPVMLVLLIVMIALLMEVRMKSMTMIMSSRLVWEKEAKLGPPEASSHLDFTRDAQVVLSHSVPSLIIALHHHHIKKSNKQT